jgi:hypothetical protein
MGVCPVAVVHRNTHNNSASSVRIYPLFRINMSSTFSRCLIHVSVGPDVWPLDYPECSGERQSPIDLEVDDMYRLEVSDQLRWHGYRTRPQDLTLTNNRHTGNLFMRHKIKLLVSARERCR